MEKESGIVKKIIVVILLGGGIFLLGKGIYKLYFKETTTNEQQPEPKKQKNNSEWIAIHEDFKNEAILKNWRDEVIISLADAKKWLDLGFTTADADLIGWMRYNKKEDGFDTPENFKESIYNSNDIEFLREEFAEWKEEQKRLFNERFPNAPRTRADRPPIEEYESEAESSESGESSSGEESEDETYFEPEELISLNLNRTQEIDLIFRLPQIVGNINEENEYLDNLKILIYNKLDLEELKKDLETNSEKKAIWIIYHEPTFSEISSSSSSSSSGNWKVFFYLKENVLLSFESIMRKQQILSSIIWPLEREGHKSKSSIIDYWHERPEQRLNSISKLVLQFYLINFPFVIDRWKVESFETSGLKREQELKDFNANVLLNRAKNLLEE